MSECTKVGVVLPTCRPERIPQWLASWNRAWGQDVELIIVSDGADKVASIAGVHVISSDGFASKPWGSLVETNSSGVRAAGFAFAAELGCREIVTLDDDCLPCSASGTVDRWIERHRENASYPVVDSPFDGLHMRGMPYGENRTLKAALNFGLWSKDLDLDACHELVFGRDSQNPKVERKYYQPGVFVPICGMNVWFQSWLLPAYYYPRLPYAGCRFDDIWAGLICKRVCDMLGLTITSGYPVVRHDRASDSFDNLCKEAEGIRMHQEIWRLVMDTKVHGVPRDYLDSDSQKVVAVSRVTRQLAADVRFNSRGTKHQQWVEQWMENLLAWSKIMQDVLLESLKS